MHEPGSGVFEIVLPFRGDAFRVVYAVQIADEMWVVHAFQKKSPRVTGGSENQSAAQQAGRTPRVGIRVPPS